MPSLPVLFCQRRLPPTVSPCRAPDRRQLLYSLALLRGSTENTGWPLASGGAGGLPAVEAPIQNVGSHRQPIHGSGGHHICAPIDRAQALKPETSTNRLGAHALTLLAKLLRDPRPAVASSAVTMDRRHLRIQGLVRQRPCAERLHAPLTVPCAGHQQHPAQPADCVLAAIVLDPGVLHRDTLAKYAVAFRRISTSSFASASSLRSRLFSASSFVTSRRSGYAELVAN